MVEAFHRELAGVDGAAYGREVTLDDLAVHDPRSPTCVLGKDHGGRQVEDHGDRRNAGRPGSGQDRSPVRRDRVRRIDDRGSAFRHPAVQSSEQDPEGERGGSLVRLIPGDGKAQGVRRQDLVGFEAASGHRRLTRPRRADQHGEARVGQDQGRHRVGVGMPLSG